MSDAEDFLRTAESWQVDAALRPTNETPDAILTNAMGQTWVADHFGVDEGDDAALSAAAERYNRAYYDTLRVAVQMRELKGILDRTSATDADGNDIDAYRELFVLACNEVNGSDLGAATVAMDSAARSTMQRWLDAHRELADDIWNASIAGQELVL